jgi:hypothetical protein
MKKIKLVSLFLFVVFILSCSKSSSRKSNMALMEVAGKAYDNVSMLPPQAPAVDVDRKIIKEGNLTFETKDINAARIQIGKCTKDLKGFIADETAYTYEDKIEHTLVLRVPAENFDLLLSCVSANAEKIDSKNVSLQDVTEEFIDIQARLKTKKESVEGRLKYLNDRVSLCRLNVTYYQKTKSPFHFSSKLGESLKNGWRNLMWFFIGLINLWPFIIAGIVALIIVLRINRKNKIKKTV